MLKNIIYVSIPEEFIKNIKEFEFDPSIFLPVEVNDIENVSQDDVNIESVMSAILKIFAYDPENSNIQYYRKLILTLNPDIFTNLINIGLIKAEEGEYNLALEVFLALKGFDGQNEILLLNLALLYERMIDNFLKTEQDKDAQEYGKKATEIYETLLNQKDLNENVYANAGFFFIKQYKLDKAEKLLKKYLSVSHNEKLKNKVSEVLFVMEKQKNLDFNLEKIYDLIILSREDEAIDEALKILDVNKNSWNTWFLLGWAYRRKDLYENARDAFFEVLSLSKDNVDAMNELAICYMETNEFDKALKNLLEALKIEPNNVKIISNIGILYLKMNEKDKARKYFEIVLEFEPSDSIALKYLSIL